MLFIYNPPYNIEIDVNINETDYLHRHQNMFTIFYLPSCFYDFQTVD